MLRIAQKEVSPGKAGGFSFGAAQSGLSMSHQTKRPFDSVECSTPHDLLIRCSLRNLQFPAIALTWCCLTSHGHRSIEPFFMSLAARDSEFRRWSGRVDRRICQTFAASPAEPGELPLGFSQLISVDFPFLHYLCFLLIVREWYLPTVKPFFEEAL